MSARLMIICENGSGKYCPRLNLINNGLEHGLGESSGCTGDTSVFGLLFFFVSQARKRETAFQSAYNIGSILVQCQSMPAILGQCF